MKRKKAILTLLYLRQQKQKRNRRYSVHPINRVRYVYGEFHHLWRDLRNDEIKFFAYFRMNFQMFDYLVTLISPFVVKHVTTFRSPISVEQRLAVSLRFLATGNSFASLAFNFRMGKCTVSGIVYETCDALWECLKSHLEVPDTKKWKEIAGEFEEKWNFPHCIGAIDGKHIRMKAPNKSGSLYFNYKGYFSFVLLALVDANYKFIAVDIGSLGSNSDGGILVDSNLGKGLEMDALGIPQPEILPMHPQFGPLPYVIVGDEAFPLKSYMMRPYPGRQIERERMIFNYRLSRARRVSENAFGILASRFRIYHRSIEMKPSNLIKVVQATVVLHNLLQKENNSPFETQEIDPCPLNGVPARAQGNRSTQNASNVRNRFKEYFNTSGVVEWQNQQAHCDML